MSWAVRLVSLFLCHIAVPSSLWPQFSAASFWSWSQVVCCCGILMDACMGERLRRKPPCSSRQICNQICNMVTVSHWLVEGWVVGILGPHDHTTSGRYVPSFIPAYPPPLRPSSSCPVILCKSACSRHLILLGGDDFAKPVSPG
jgi:hypothetical protein